MTLSKSSQGDRRDQAIAKVVRDWSGRLFSFIRRRVSSDEDAEDVLQDVWQQLSTQPEIDAIRQMSGWLHEVARNRAIDRSRKQREVLLDDLASPGPDEDGESLGLEQFLVADETPEGQYLNRLFWDTLVEALDRLPTEQRQVFVENELEGRTLRELAEESSENIKTLIYRKGAAVKALRRELADLNDMIGNTTE
ncbi:MAG: RNA polymerase sigma factor [Lautropia sp.]